jgi:hypothetical protein
MNWQRVRAPHFGTVVMKASDRPNDSVDVRHVGGRWDRRFV